MPNLIHDLRNALRGAATRPGFTFIVILTLALGIGANTAIFTVLNAVLLEALPYPDPDRLVRVYESAVDDPTSLQFLRAPIVSEYRTWTDIFDNLGSIYTYREVGADLTDSDQPQRVAVISNRLWADHFRARPDVVGSSMQLDGSGFEIVGVMPPGFTNPFGSRTDVWIPQNLRPGGSNNFGNYYLSVVARLRDGVSLEAAQERAAVLATGFAEAQPDAADSVPRLVPLQEDVVGPDRRSMLWILAAAAGLVLLTACINVANLLFARGLERDRDLALRAALGSGRGRLVASILTENGLLALGGGAAGVLLGWLGMRALVSAAPNALPMASQVELGGKVLGFALIVTAATILVFGLAPALRLSRTSGARILRSGDRAVTRGRAARRLTDGLVIVQIGAALVLVAGSMLLARSFGRLLDVPLGIEPAGVLTYEVHLPGSRYADGAARQRLYDELRERVAALPGVDRVGATSWLPADGRFHTWGFYWDPEAPDGSNDDAWYSTDVRVIDGDYFGAMGIDVIQGQSPIEVDFDAEPMAWVNRTLADSVMGANAVGQQIWLAGDVRRIMGIVEDIPYDTRGNVSRKAYVPHVQYADDRNWGLIQTVKSHGNLADLGERIRGEIAAIDPLLVLYRPRPFDDVLGAVRAQDRFATLLMGTFGTLALVLALVGTYGVLAGSVAGRTREIGIRMAMGADAGNVRAMVLRYAVSLVIPGIALGLLGAWLGSRWIGALLFRIEPADPMSLGLALLAFVGVGALSGWLPAVRATRVDAVQALRSD